MIGISVADIGLILLVEGTSFGLARKFLLRSLSPSIIHAAEDRKYSDNLNLDDDSPMLPSINDNNHKQSSLITFTPSSALKLSRYSFSFVFAQAFTILIIAIANAVDILQTPTVAFLFKVSLSLLLSFVIFLIPYLQCFLFIRLRHASNSTNVNIPSIKRTFKISMVPFVCYLILFSTIPLPLSNASSLIGKALARSVALGVMILAVLSGVGVVSTTFMFLHAVSKRNWLPVSLEDIHNSERALNHVQNQLDEVKDRVRSFEMSLNVKSNNDSSSYLPNWLSTWTFSSKLPTNLKSELNGLQSLEYQMILDLDDLKFKHERQEFSKTILGKLYVLLGHTFALYCIIRVMISLINLLLIRKRSTSGSSPDYVSKILGSLIAHLFGSPDAAPIYAKQISLVSVGLIILSNVKSLLMLLNRIFKKIAGSGDVISDSGNSSIRTRTTFLIFFLSQLMGSFFLTMLVQLHTSLQSSSNFDLLSSLPNIDLFGTAFDAPFVISAALTALFKKL